MWDTHFSHRHNKLTAAVMVHPRRLNLLQCKLKRALALFSNHTEAFLGVYIWLCRVAIYLTGWPGAGSFVSLAEHHATHVAEVTAHMALHSSYHSVFLNLHGLLHYAFLLPSISISPVPRNGRSQSQHEPSKQHFLPQCTYSMLFCYWYPLSWVE